MKRVLPLIFGFLGVFAMAQATEVPAQPKLEVTTLQGDSWSLAAHRGQWVVINFWATWCTPCIKEMPEISDFVKSHKQVSAIGLAYEDSEKTDVLAFMAKHPVVYPIAQLDPFKPPTDFDTPRGLPTTYVIAPDGTVKKKHVGPITAVDLAKLIGVKPE